MKAQPEKVRAGDVFELRVRVRIAGGQHIYASDSKDGDFTPTAVKLHLPATVEALGEWVFPEPVTTSTGRRIYTDSIELRRKLKVRADAVSGTSSLEGELSCQACNEELCWPPVKLPLLTPLEIAR
jgi:hypothetical protein